MEDEDGLREGAQAGPGFEYARAVALSDGVFAIALTLLVLTLDVPDLASGEQDQLAEKLWDQAPTLGAYVLSFAVIARFWVRHHHFFRSLDRIDGWTMTFNLVYLGLVTFVPFPTDVLGSYGDEPVSVVLYAVTLLAIALVSAAMTHHAVTTGLTSVPEEPSWAWAWPAGVLLLSIPVAFLSTIAAMCLWIALPAYRLLTARRPARPSR